MKKFKLLFFFLISIAIFISGSNSASASCLRGDVSPIDSWTLSNGGVYSNSATINHVINYSYAGNHTILFAYSLDGGQYVSFYIKNERVNPSCPGSASLSLGPLSPGNHTLTILTAAVTLDRTSHVWISPAVSFTVIDGAVNQRPSPPRITISDGNAYTSLPISAVSTDPEGDSIRYAFFDEGPPPDFMAPPWVITPYLTSNQLTNQVTPATWAPFSRTISVRACDSGSGRCSMARTGVNLAFVPPPPPVVSISAMPNYLNQGDTSFTLNWNATGVSSCKVVDNPATYNFGWNGSQVSPAPYPLITTPSGLYAVTDANAPNFSVNFSIECQPLQGGSPIIASANVTKSSISQSGVCGSANGSSNFTSAPTISLCNVGSSSPSPVTPLGSVGWRWDCRGVNGGANADPHCFARRNQAPIVDAGLDRVINLPRTSVNLSGTARDPDLFGSISNYLWTKVTGPAETTSRILVPNNPGVIVGGLVEGTYVFRLTATDNYGATGYDDVQVDVTSQPNISVLVSPFSGVVTEGDPFTISMSSTNATSCFWSRTGTYTSDNWTNELVPPPNTSYNSGPRIFPAGNATYSFTCTNGINSVTGQKTITVVPAATPNPPTFTFTADSSAIPAGGNTTLRWTTSGGATLCAATGGWSGSKALPSGSEVITMPMSTSYTLECSNAAGSNGPQTILITASRPTVTLTANPLYVANGGTSQLSWTSNNATNCTTSGGTAAWRTRSGVNGIPLSSGPITPPTTFTITCQNDFGQRITASKIVGIGAVCGNRICEVSKGETPLSCRIDCATPDFKEI